MTKPSSAKQRLFGPRTINALGALLLAGILAQLLAWACNLPTLRTIGIWLTVPFLILLAVLLLIVLPYTWWTARRTN